MTRIYEPSGHLANGNGDGQKWRLLTTLGYLAGLGTAIFFAGMSYQSVRSIEPRVDAQRLQLEEIVKGADATYVRKDGRDLEEIRGRLRLLDEKIDRLLRNEGLVR